MKKVLSLILAIIMCLSLCACATEGSKDDADNTKKTETTTAAGETKLTAENIFDYLAFEIKLDNVQRFQREYSSDYTPPANAATSGFERGDINLNIFAKKPVYFADAKIVIDLVPTRSEYDPVENKSYQLRFDGVASDTFKYICSVVGDNPEFEVVVKEVSGTVVAK